MTSTRIGQVRIRTNTDDPLAARMRGDAALRALDLEPAGMPERTILCIRAMDDPLPGGIDLRSSHAPRATEWERAARDAVRDALHRAVRVIDDAVPSNANAVLFDDRAELLACAARDVVRGSGGWWWRDLVRGGLAFEPVVREWVRSPEYVPAALELLLPNGHAITFARLLEPQHAIELVRNVLRVHAMETFARDVIEALQTSTPPTPRIENTPPPMIRKLVPDFATTDVLTILTVEQCVFATITLALRRAPAIARSAAFAHELSTWIGPFASRAISATTTSVTTEASIGHDSSTPILDALSQSIAVEPAAIAPQAARIPIHTNAAHIDANAPTEPTSSSSPAQSPSTPIHVAITEADPSPLAHEETPIAPAPFITPIAATAVDSRYAGLFFLLNVAIALGLYDPYGREQPIPLDVWDFLALTGRALIPDLEVDDLWPLLAMLAHRGIDDDLPTLDDDLLARVREALALVFDEDARDDNAAHFVIHRPGRITLSPAHLDVTFSLAAHPIEIRLAGLDRNPGWIPAAGRHVDFHFD